MQDVIEHWAAATKFCGATKNAQFASVCSDLHGRTHFFWSDPEFLSGNV
jgi:hypothetical protein